MRVCVGLPSLYPSTMKPSNRKLRLLYDVGPNGPSPINSSAQNYSPSISISISSPSLPPPPASQPRTAPPSPQRSQQQQQQQQQPYPHASAHFDGSMALTVLIFLTALSFMGFFSIYVRRFASDDSAADYSPHRGRRRQQDQPATSRTATSGVRKGADPEVVKSLPVYSYYHEDAKYQMDCAICLGEFQENEIVKMIPHCQHVFHLQCIDTWLKMHVTCPVCRGTQFIELTAQL
uniref:RING-type E3 ubiquitin transferase n=1 Tax=Rhizophora mucronata TaxID=61149 RepID=A0A2P2MXI0_RHIMU